MSQKSKKVGAGGILSSVIRTILTYAFCIGIILAAVLFAMDKSPQKSVFGYRYYTVLTPSMMPAYSVGDVVIVKLANASDVREGDVITFNPSSDADTYLTHRVTEVLPDYEGTGVTCFRTKGDANEDEDSFLLDSSRLIGTVSFAIPKVGYLVRFVQLKWYLVLPLVLLIILLIKLLGMYSETLREGSERTAQS